MLSKFKEGLFWGLGFVIAIISITYGADLIEGYITRVDPYLEPEPIRDVPYEIVKHTYRLVPSSDEFKGGLVISGQIKFEYADSYKNLRLVAFVKDGNGVYVDTCSEHGLSESPIIGQFYFKIMCSYITEKEQFESYEFELRGNKI